MTQIDAPPRHLRIESRLALRPGPILARIALALALGISGPLAAQPADATGVWRTEATDEGYLEIGIAPCGGGVLCGTILRARDTTGAEQPYPHTGRLMVWDMTPADPGTWRDGQIWDPRNDRIFNSRMALEGESLLVSGCVLGICQSQTWERAD